MQKRDNICYASGFWSFPGGHVEAKESLKQAIQRELEEEVGVKIDLESFCCLTLCRKPEKDQRYVNFFYLVDKWEGEPSIQEAKASELAFVSPNDLPNPILPYIKEALALIHNKVGFHESEY